MIRKEKGASFPRACLVLLIVLGVWVNGARAGQAVSGTYSLKESTDLGTQVRITMQIRFANASEQRLIITEMGLQNHLRPARASADPGSVILEPRLGIEVTREFTISKEEFEHLRRNNRPRLELTIRTTAGVETTATIALMRRPT